MPVLEVRDLSTHFVSRDLDDRVRVARALTGVSFTVDAGRMLGLVGETGAGKSLAAMSILGLLRAPARVVSGQALFDGQDLLALPPRALDRIRGDQVALVVQSPKSSLDPTARVGAQIRRVQRAHGRPDAAARAASVLRDVGIADPDRVLRAWPHELSGGMAQRVLIAMAMVNRPRLLIADEPTTGLDVTVQAQILDLIRTQVDAAGLGAIVITHDLGVVAQYCDDLAVLYAGHLVEQGPVRDVFRAPAHPYTAGLLLAAAETGRPPPPTAPPDLFAAPGGCPYRAGCGLAHAACVAVPPARAVGAGHTARCWAVAA